MVKLRKRKINKSIIIILILFISIGFAALTSNLNILSNVTFLPQSFNIYFDNLQVNQKSSNLDNPTLSNDDTTVTFTSTINEPGDFYEFSFDVVNAGTMDAALDEIIKSGLTPTQEQYLDYTARYYGEREIHEDDILHAGYKEKIIVRVEYKYNIENVPSLGNISFSFGLNYIKRDLQKDYGEETWSIEYTGSERTLNIPKTGLYRLETWGAQGGYGYSEELYPGGYGGYSTGTLSLTKNDNIYVTVGGVGNSGCLKVNCDGGYNGGGISGRYTHDDQNFNGGGGGATHISTNSGLLSELSNDQSSIIIVSGGGGGSLYRIRSKDGTNGGSGGGYIGSGSINLGPTVSGTGGSQTSSGSNINTLGTQVTSGFGNGAIATSYNSPGGGAGLYGGGIASGGSGYIGNTNLTNKVMYCYNCQESTSEADETHIKTRSTTNHSEEPISYYAKEENGFARITYLGNYNVNQYTVINYHPNGGEGNMDTQIITANSTLNENKYTRDGYTFVGWSTTEKELSNLIVSIPSKSNFTEYKTGEYTFDYSKVTTDAWIKTDFSENIISGTNYTLLFNVKDLTNENAITFSYPVVNYNNKPLKTGLNKINFSTWNNTSSKSFGHFDDVGNDGLTSGTVYNFFLYKDSEVDYLDKANITYSSNTCTVNLYALWAKVES